MKAQITIFILIGVIVLAGISAMLYYGAKEAPAVIERETEAQQQWQDALHSARVFFQDCFEEGVASGINLITHQGGVIYESQGGKTPDATPQDSVLFENHNVRYAIIPPKGNIGNIYYSDVPQYPWQGFPYLEKNGKTTLWWYGYYGRTNLPPLYDNFTGSIQTNLVSYLTNYLESTCAKDYLAPERGATLTALTWQTPIVNMTISSDTKFVLTWTKESPEKILFTAELPAELKNEKFRARLGAVSTALQIRLSKMYYFISEIIEKDATDLNFSLRGFFPNQMRVSLIPQGTSDIIKITDTLSLLDNQPLEFTFARQNRAPALYQLCTPPLDTALCPGSTIFFKNLSKELPACKPILPPCAKARNETGLVLRMTFDSPIKNKAEDTSGQNNHGTPRGPITVPGLCAGALQFDGDDYIDIGNPSTLAISGNQITTEAWIKFYDTTTSIDTQLPQGFITVISKWESTAAQPGTAGWGLFLGGGGRPMFMISNTGAEPRIIAEGIQPLAPNIWYYLAGTYDGKTATVYVDSKPVGTAQGNGAIHNTPARVMIGAYDFKPTTSFFRGAIDEARIYTRALTQQEINVHYLQDKNNKQQWETPTNTSQTLPHIIIDNPVHCGADTAIPLNSTDPDEDITTYFTTPTLPHNLTSKEAIANSATGYSLKVYTRDDGDLTDYQIITLPVTYTLPEKPVKEQTDQAILSLCDKLSIVDTGSDGPSSTTTANICRWICSNNKVYDCSEKCERKEQQVLCQQKAGFGTVLWSQKLIEALDDCTADISPSRKCIALRSAIIGLTNTTIHPYSSGNPGDPLALH